MAINIISLIFLLTFFIWGFFPVATPVQLSSMNWGCVIYGAVILFSTVYYVVVGRKVYTSPVDRVNRYL